MYKGRGHISGTKPCKIAEKSQQPGPVRPKRRRHTDCDINERCEDEEKPQQRQQAQRAMPKERADEYSERPLFISDQDAGDQIAGKCEEDLHPDPAWREVAKMKAHDHCDSDGTDTVERFKALHAVMCARGCPGYYL